MASRKSARFEILVARIQAGLSPGARVQHNERIRGRKSGALRQVDVTVRQQAGQFPLLIAIECKDLSRPANVKHVEDFGGLLEDIGAHKGAMVSARGFSATARKRAAEAGIDLYRLVDAEDHDWRAYVTLPLLFHDLAMVRWRFALALRTPPEPGFDADSPELELFDSDGKSLGSPDDILRRIWNEGGVTDSPGHFKDMPLLEGKPLFVQHRSKLYPMRLLLEGWVERESYFGHIPLSSISGFSDELNGGIITRGYATELLSFAELERSFLKVRRPGQLAVQPALEVCIRTMIPEPTMASR